jgi:hypothetical protein
MYFCVRWFHVLKCAANISTFFETASSAVDGQINEYKRYLNACLRLKKQIKILQNN